jgi:uncharacterized coiled-coil protein SlyX
LSIRRRNTIIETEVLRRSGRRCCLCFGLCRDFEVKQGQIAHLDRDSANTTIENLVFLCLEHHNQYDTRTSQSKGLTIQEVKAYREELYDAMEAFRDNNLPKNTVDNLEGFIEEQRNWLARIYEKVELLTNEWQEFQEVNVQQIKVTLSIEEN